MPRKLLRCLAVVVLGAVVISPAWAERVWSPQIGTFVNLKRQPKETPELQVEFARSLLQQGDYKGAEREAGKFDVFYADTDFADDNQFLRGEIEMAKGKRLDASREFEQVILDYPETDLFDEVMAKQYEIADFYYAKGVANLDKGWWRRYKRRPFRRAITVYSVVIKDQPFQDAAAEAQYKIGLCHFTVEEYLEAGLEYRRVIEDYAKSAWVDEALYGLAMCHYNASLPAPYDQSPSQLTINTIDDFLTRFPGHEQAADLKAKRVEMRTTIAEQRLLTAQFYEKRRKFEAATIYYQIVADEFEETPSAQQARAWLGGHAGSEG